MLAVIALLHAGCATSPLPAPFTEGSALADGGAQVESTAAPVRRERPGLGTTWGERRESPVESTSFVRADRMQPLAVGKAFYNDADGARAMLSGRSFRKGSGDVIVGGGLVGFALQDAAGRLLQSHQSGDDRIFIGKRGQRYSLVAENLTSCRLELVMSVDGLDVLDGEPASYSKRGYVLNAGERLTVAGFRESAEAVAAFRFGSVAASYAERRHGDARNVGVIGIAVFHEKGTRPRKWSHPDRRLDADPFPRRSRFAKPPPASD